MFARPRGKASTSRRLHQEALSHLAGPRVWQPLACVAEQKLFTAWRSPYVHLLAWTCPPLVPRRKSL
eukprot:8775825-Pyramimonas_sp.AAC.1